MIFDWLQQFIMEVNLWGEIYSAENKKKKKNDLNVYGDVYGNVYGNVYGEDIYGCDRIYGQQLGLNCITGDILLDQTALDIFPPVEEETVNYTNEKEVKAGDHGRYSLLDCFLYVYVYI